MIHDRGRCGMIDFDGFGRRGAGLLLKDWLLLLLLLLIVMRSRDAR